MCMFTGAVQWVSGTSIFVRGEGERQLLAYGMKVASEVEVAMVLPVPTPAAPSEDALLFIDLSGYAELFEDLAKGVFPVSGAAPGPASLSAPQPQLEVHAVGSFVASFVPTMADFERLDPRFRLAPEVWARLPQYADWSFAVFQLAAGKRDFHPMGFSFPRRDRERLFFPAVHVHEGRVGARAHFDHRLFHQPAHEHPPPPPTAPEPGVVVPVPEWFPSWRPARNFVDTERTGGIVHPACHVHGRSLWGEHPNADIWVEEATG